MSVREYLGEFLRAPSTVGAIAPSGRELARKLVAAAQPQDGEVVVELGAGTGAITAAVPVSVRRFVALEPHPPFAAGWRARFPARALDARGAEELPAVLRDRGWAAADCVLSSLPFAIWPEARQRRVLDGIVAGMHPLGRLVTFGYLHSQLLPAAGRLQRLLAARFVAVRRQAIAWWNLPPALVFRCDEPRRADP